MVCKGKWFFRLIPLSFSMLLCHGALAETDDTSTLLAAHQNAQKQVLELMAEIKTLEKVVESNQKKNEQNQKLISSLSEKQADSGLDSSAARWQAFAQDILPLVLTTSFMPEFAELKRELEKVIADPSYFSALHVSQTIEKLHILMSMSDKFETKGLPVLQADGQVKIMPTVQLGTMGWVSALGELQWHPERHVFVPRSPHNASNWFESLQAAPSDTLVTLPNQIADISPDIHWLERVQQGGWVGMVILALLGFGCVLTSVRFVVLNKLHRKIQYQIAHPNHIQDNPAGDILRIHAQDRSQAPEVLEMRVSEVVITTQMQVEKGLPALKLMAAVAPMLGLLGTVTGMIQTFQVMANAGQADLPQMAGGIATALVTTVLGIIAAIPLLFAHQGLSSLSERILSRLEKESLKVIAERWHESTQSSSLPHLEESSKVKIRADVHE